MHNFKEFKVWQQARELVKEIYLLSKVFPQAEKFGLISQIRRSAVSIPSNIAEGSGRGSNKEFAQFLSIALGSAYELDTQLILAFDLGLIPDSQLKLIVPKLEMLQKMLFGLHKKLKENLP
jgi:four helix bundle protein